MFCFMLWLPPLPSLSHQEINGCLADYLIKDNEHRRQDEDYACHTDQGTS